MPEKCWFLRLKNLIFFKNSCWFSQLKMCCGNSFDFRKFSTQHHTTKLSATDWVDQKDYFCNVLCDNERSRKFSKVEWIATTHFHLWKTTQFLEKYEIFEPKKTQFLRRLMLGKNFVFWISEKAVGNNPHNVYIFLTSYVRAFQNRFDHVHTTSLHDSTIAQLGPII